MDNENIRIEFVNGSTITSRYEPYSDFRYVDTRTPFDEPNTTTRGHRASGLVYDEFAGFDWSGDYSESLVDMFNTVQTGYTVPTDEVQSLFNKWWYEVGQYEFSIDGDKITIKQKEAPDFGEISPSQELNDFVNALVRGE